MPPTASQPAPDATARCSRLLAAFDAWAWARVTDALTAERMRIALRMRRASSRTRARPPGGPVLGLPPTPTRAAGARPTATIALHQAHPAAGDRDRHCAQYIESVEGAIEGHD
eukprot:scaffold28784_cov112-Isochrysis_galbana.AAC.1